MSDSNRISALARRVEDRPYFLASALAAYARAEALSDDDLAGRLVARLGEARVGTGRHVVGWDGRGDGGRQVAPGMYFLRLTTGETAATGKLVLAR